MSSRRRTPSELAPIPASVDASQGIKLLIRRIEAAREILSRPPLTSDDYDAWETLTNDFLIKVFGSNSPNVPRVMEVGKAPGLTWGRRTEAEYEQDRRRHLTTQIRTLESLVESLQTEVELRAFSVASGDTRDGTGEIDPRKVFVVHGRNEHARVAIAAFLRSIDLRPIEWTEAVKLTGEASPFIGQVLEAAFCAAQAVIVILTGDDLARLHPNLVNPSDPAYERKATPQARPNVLFEAGFSFAKHPKRTVIVEFGRLRPFSDVQGRHVIRMDNSVQKRQELAERLKAAGCTVNTLGVDWNSAGDFESGLTPNQGPQPDDTATRRRRLGP
jgi:predicted nucleotide-binding protein